MVIKLKEPFRRGGRRLKEQKSPKLTKKDNTVIANLHLNVRNFFCSAIFNPNYINASRKFSIFSINLDSLGESPKNLSTQMGRSFLFLFCFDHLKLDLKNYLIKKKFADKNVLFLKVQKKIKKINLLRKCLILQKKILIILLLVYK